MPVQLVYISKMIEKHDFTIPNGLGIRILAGPNGDGRICQVIRRQRGAWKEIGRPYQLPLQAEDLQWTRNGIPATVIAVALRAYELGHPGSSLRHDLTSSRVLCAAS
jgi:hypothetical protein